MKNVEEVKQELMEIIGICERISERDKYFLVDYNSLKGLAQGLLDAGMHPMDFKVDAAGFRRKFEQYFNGAYDRILREKRIYLIKIADVSGDNKISKELNLLANNIKDFLERNEYSLETNKKYENFWHLVSTKIEEVRREHEKLN